MRGILIALTVAAATPAWAKVTYPVAIPGECMVLAQREGVPTVINNRYEAAKAKYKLYRLSARDPLVHQCKDAVERARQALRHPQEVAQ
jgi:hypothetical protein